MESKPPKGTRDYDPTLESQRQRIVDICKKVCMIYGAQPIQTPLFEVKHLIMEKYSNDTDNEVTKQVYDLCEGESIVSSLKNILDKSDVSRDVRRDVRRDVSRDVDGSGDGESGSSGDKTKEELIRECIEDFEKSEQCVLRYDLTVPFARFVKTVDCNKLTRYQIGTVYRKDQPNMKSGRFREFMQCDFDILGNDNDPIAANAETLDALYTMLSMLDVQKFVIKVNSRSVLEDLFNYCKVPNELFRPICSSIDKLDKHDWKYVKNDMESKGLSAEAIGMLQFKIEEIKTETKNNWSVDSINKIDILCDETKKELIHLRENLDFRLSGSYAKNFQFDISLARGLDYYTSLIFEVVVSSPKGKIIGSVAGGGRYDKLCGVKCVGFSIGIDRLLNYLQSEKKLEDTLIPPTYDFWVIQVGDKLKQETEEMLFRRRQEVVKKFRQFGWKAGTELRPSAGLGNQMKLALKMRIPYVIFIGEQEYKSEKMTIKIMKQQQQYDMLTFPEIMLLVKNSK